MLYILVGASGIAALLMFGIEDVKEPQDQAALSKVKQRRLFLLHASARA